MFFKSVLINLLLLCSISLLSVEFTQLSGSDIMIGIGSQEMTLEEIGEKFGLTRERVRQIKEKAIRRLRHTSRSKLLRSYLG